MRDWRLCMCRRCFGAGLGQLLLGLAIGCVGAMAVVGFVKGWR